MDVLFGPVLYEGSIIRTVSVGAEFFTEVWTGSTWKRDGRFTFNDVDKGRSLSAEELSAHGLLNVTEGNAGCHIPHSDIERERLACYCRYPDIEILNNIVRGDIPEEALIMGCCWKRICQVRGRGFSFIDAEIWREICRRRAYLLY